MPSVTDMVNVSLRLIGQTPISSLTDGSTTANVMDDLYTEARDQLLRMHNWNFATKRSKLAQSSTAPPFEFDYAYPLPSDWIRTVSAHDNDAGYGGLLYRMEFVGSQRVIVCNSDQVYLRYVYQVSDANLMTPDFRECLEILLARNGALAIASSNVMFDTYDKKFKQVLARARSTDSMGSYPEMRPKGSWAKSRNGRSDDYFSD
jgi:hypothetical protein